MIYVTVAITFRGGLIGQHKQLHIAYFLEQNFTARYFMNVMLDCC